MDVETALLEQGPSLALQRAAADRIAQLRKESHDAYTNGYQAARAEIKACLEHEANDWAGDFSQPVRWAMAGVADQLGISTDGILNDREAELRNIIKREF